ncbi:AMP nucleosidase [Marinicauda algicola]|uniref:AMP nucleosidase n=1 Tax=Marinicauda algicola TaxID=2029849 RepID=A0A4V3RXZ6_9PROT|nr:AMP nucleosidase [Marinicauda algicola]TGY88419.1 AMP nucleosidase [Marinicauda algicola]
MADQPHRITFLAKTFSAAALEFHRGRMAEKGYRMEGRIESTVFHMIDAEGRTDPAFEGEPLFAVTFVKRED